MADRDRISIVMCTYNGGLYLREQLDSLLRQTRKADEIVVQDDCSTDSTLDILAEYSRKYPYIKVYANKTRMGYNRNFLSALARATGELIALSDQDDVWRKDKLAVMERSMADGVSMAFHNSALFARSPHETTGVRYTKRPSTDAVFITVKPCIPGHEMMFRRDVLATVALLGDINIMYDYSIATICANSGRVVYVDDTLVYWRRHAQAATFAERKIENKAAGYVKSLLALADGSRRSVAKRYFALMDAVLPCQNRSDSRRLVAMLASGNLLWRGGILGASAVCLAHLRSISHSPNARNALRAIFLPVNFIRDYGVFIIRE